LTMFSHTMGDRLKLVAVDVEATSLNPKKAHVVSAALIPITDDLQIDYARALVIDVPVEASGESALIHGYTGVYGTEYARVERLRLLFSLLEDKIMVTYTSYDACVLGEEARRVGINVRLCYFDVLEMVLSTTWGKRFVMSHHRLTLEDVVRGLLGLEPVKRRFHDPLADALYAALIYVHLVKAGIKPTKRCLRSKTNRLLGWLRNKLS